MRLVRQMGLVELARRKCVSYNSKTPPMKRADVQKYLQQLNGWTLAGSNILKEFEFRDYLEGQVRLFTRENRGEGKPPPGHSHKMEESESHTFDARY